ncbi:CheR family methyltransferase [Paracoccus albus]|uniref:CheR family methyltransferase n=1 Tax=Paracoccus albus TaxID=3017784 RepID=UPI0022F0B830|nr:protein-glutamate O-methyltransferase CheR [Paracoccus albus]WBU61220.1 protein-glutamate O-methyltransferase CheR [Paracoccus albus]
MPPLFGSLNHAYRGASSDFMGPDPSFISTSANNGEREHFISSITTNVTSFFREKHHFDLLTEKILADSNDVKRSLNIWSAGCSSGQEPYSIAMCLLQALPDLAARTQILATDIDVAILRKAEVGIYTRKELMALPPAFLGRSFFSSIRNAQSDEMQLQHKIRNMVKFQNLNLNSSWAMPVQFDIIFCRNVAIYFSQTTQERLWRRFVTALRPGGWLLIGHAERIPPELHSILRPNGMTAYQKIS